MAIGYGMSPWDVMQVFMDSEDAASFDFSKFKDFTIVNIRTTSDGTTTISKNVVYKGNCISLEGGSPRTSNDGSLGK